MANIQAGIMYHLFNVKRGTCMDLSGSDRASIIGYQFHSGSNQMWIFESVEGDKIFKIKSAWTGTYLSVSGGVRNGAKLIATNVPYQWHVEDVDGRIRISPANNSSFCVDLSDYGNSTLGALIVLSDRRDSAEDQIWKLKDTENNGSTVHSETLSEKSKMILECNKNITESIVEITKLLGKIVDSNNCIMENM